MAIVFIIVGLVMALFLNTTIGLMIMLIGFVLLFVPAAPYGQNWYRGRRGR